MLGNSEKIEFNPLGTICSEIFNFEAPPTILEALEYPSEPGVNPMGICYGLEVFPKTTHNTLEYPNEPLVDPMGICYS